MKSFLQRILIVCGLASVLTMALIAVDYYTRPIIEKNSTLKLKKGVLTANGIPFTPQNAEAVFNADVQQVKKGGQVFYLTRDGAVSFAVTGSGLWAPITVVVSLEPDLTTIKGLSVINQAETPGLGSRVAEPEFLKRFHGKSVSPLISIVKPGKASGKNQVDGITGATMTTTAFQLILNSEVLKAAGIYKGVGR
jgi:Na+-transporting NADH:ubiquinone oxidoreductase subunit NqrC